MPVQEPSDFANRRALAMAASMAILGWGALVIECGISLHKSFADGSTVAAALFFFLRYFTILTNIGVAGLMTVTAWRLARGRPLPPANLYAAGLVYVVVVGITYEAMLRRLWSPQGVQFYTDMAMHDVIPIFSLVFWFAFAPKTPLRWNGPLRWLEFPAVYFVATLIAGDLGAGYPYGFIDVDKLGYPGALGNALVFLAVFYGLGLCVVAAARVRPSLRAEDEARQTP